MATVPIEIQDNAILVHAAVNRQDIVFVIDTGDAVGPVFNAHDAQWLDLKNDGPIGVSGAGGSVEIYATEADVGLGGILFQNEPSAVDTNLQGSSLLGLPFFIKQGGILAFDFAHNTLTFGSAHVAKHHQRLDTLLEEWIHHDNPNTGDEVQES
jgi:hypothetical protein